MADITIPREAEEAAAKDLYDEWRINNNVADSTPEWSELDDDERESYVRYTRAACLAMLRNWPGMVQGRYDWEPAIILPLTENPNAE